MSELQKSVARLRAAQEKLKKQPEKIQKIRKLASESFYKDEGNKAKGDAYQALERLAKAHGAIAAAVKMLQDGQGPVSGIALYNALENGAQVFPVDSDKAERKKIFFRAGLSDLATDGDKNSYAEYGGYVDQLWQAVEPSVDIVVAKQLAVNDHLANAFEQGIK